MVLVVMGSPLKVPDHSISFTGQITVFNYHLRPPPPVPATKVTPVPALSLSVRNRTVQSSRSELSIVTRHQLPSEPLVKTTPSRCVLTWLSDRLIWVPAWNTAIHW